MGVLLAPLLLIPALLGLAKAENPPLEFEVTYTAGVHPGPVTARVYVMLGPSPSLGIGEPRLGPNWFNPQPFFAVDAKNWKPGEPLKVGSSPLSTGFPGSLNDINAGKYVAQAVIRLNTDTHSLGDGEGNAYSPVLTTTLDPAVGGTIKLEVDKVVPKKPFPSTDRVKLVEIDSPMLSAYLKRPVKHRAAVVLPEGDLTAKRAALYIIPGFGGDHRMALRIAGSTRASYAKDLIRVVLDPDCGTGHHVFADSAMNGPRGKALVEELIPHIEKMFPVIAEPSARLLNGHSSGGWSSLWLQVTYPNFFGGTWSTSPDPVDFRDFQRINLYRTGENMFKDAKGERRPLARRGNTPLVWYEDFSRMEDVIGDGGQLRSFEAVFSPIGPDGQALRAWDRKTGLIDTAVTKAWEAYDIRLVLEKDWATLGPKLKGKLHVYTGDLDTFYLEGAVMLLKESLTKLGSDASVEIYPGKDHGSILDAALNARLDSEMKATVEARK